MTKRAQQYLLVTLFIVVISWVVLAILSSLGIVKYGDIIFWILYLTGGFSPLFSALITNMRDKKLGEFSKLIFKCKVKFKWYIFILIIPLISYILPWLFNTASGIETDTLLRVPIYEMIFICIQMIVGGGLEEVGWRGVLLPEFQKTMSSLKSTLAVGLIWSIWHLPLWFIEGTSQHNFNFIIFALSTIVLSFLFTVLYNSTKSIFMCIMMHSLMNTYLSSFNSFYTSEVVELIIKGILFISIFVIYEVVERKKKETPKHI